MQDLYDVFERNENSTLTPQLSGTEIQDEWTRNYSPAPLLTGDLVQDPDFTLQTTAGIIPWRLFYFSKLRDKKGLFGYGRRASFPLRLCPHIVGDSIFVTIEHEDGGGASYTSNDGGDSFTCTSQRIFDVLDLETEGYIETRFTSGTKYYYIFPEDYAETGGPISLSHYTTVHGKTVTMNYEDGIFSGLTEPFGRQITYSYNSNDLVEYVEDWDSGRRHTFLYNADDCLETIIDPEGYITTFGYIDDTLLNAITNPNNFTTSYLYDSLDRVVVQENDFRAYTYTYSVGIIEAKDTIGNTWTTTVDSHSNALTVQDPIGAIRTAVYDSKGMPVLIIDASGRRITSLYNINGNEILHIRYNERPYTRIYDNFGNRIKEIDPFGKVHTYFFGGSDLEREKRLLLWEQDALGRYSTYTYRTWGALESVTNPTGSRTTYLYDDDTGLLTGEIDARGGQRTYVYDDAGKRIVEVNELGYRTTYAYDRLWRNISILEPIGAVRTVVYDGSGNIVANVDPYGYRTTYRYNALQNEIMEQDAKGYRFTAEYDTKGREIARVDPFGNRTTNIYDIADRRIVEVDALGHRVTTFYDLARRPVVVQDTAGLFYTTIYDVQLGADYWATARIAPSGHRTTNIFNRMSQLVATQDTAGFQTTTIYDAIGRIQAILEPTGARSTIKYEIPVSGFSGCANETLNAHGEISTLLYDLTGNLVVSIDPIGRRYTTAYNLASERIEEASADGTILARAYDPFLNQETITNFVDKTTITTFDLLGRVASFTDETDNTVDSIYDPLSLPYRSTDRLGNTSEITYDANRRPILLQDTTNNISATTYRADNVILQEWEGQEGVALEYTEYLYDANNRYTGSKNALNEQENIRYDNHGRVWASVAADGNAITYGFSATTGRFESELYPDGGRYTLLWDNYGRRTGYIDTENAVTQWVLDLLHRPIANIDALGQRTTYNYNAIGQLTTMQDALGTVHTNSYNLFGNVDFIVDALGNRTTYHYDQFQRLSSVENALGYRTTTHYDGFSRLVGIEDARGNRISTYYDALGRSAADIDPFGRRTTTYFDDIGRYKATEDPLGYRMTVYYDQRNRIIGYEDEIGYRSTVGYDLAGRVATVMDALGGITTSKYDAFGRPWATQDALGNTTTTHYDGFGRVAAAENSRGYRTSFFYDKRSQRIAVQDAKGYRTTTTYDALGRVVTVTDALSFQNQTIYDALGRPIVAIDPLGYRTTTSFDLLGRTTGVQDALNQRTTMAYDAIGQLITYTNAKNLVTTNQYDPVGNCTTIVTPLGQATIYTFDALNRIVEKKDPLGRAWTTVYDAAGNVLAGVDAKGQRTTSTFSPRGEEVGRSYADSALKMTFTYDALGRMKTVQDVTGRYTWGYDALGRVVTYESPQNPQGQPLTYAYDANSNLIRRSTRSGVFTYEYDARDQQTRLIEPGFPIASLTGGVTTFEYDERGLLKRQDNFDGTLATFTYEAMGRTLGVRHVKVSDGSELERAYYEYDALGRPLYKATTSSRHTYSYDALNQLTGEAWTVGSTSGRYTWDYDIANRRTTFLHDSTTTYTYDNADQLLAIDEVVLSTTLRTTLTYDNNGSQITRVEPSGHVATFEWNAANQLGVIRDSRGYVLTNLYAFDGMRHEAQRTSPTSGTGGLAETVWIEDSLPVGTGTAAENDSWTWVSSNPTPYSGTLAHQSNLTSTIGQHYMGFPSNTYGWTLSAGDVLFCWVYLDSTHPPQQLQLRFEKWSSPGYSHQASWGPLLAQYIFGAVTMGPVPSSGQWVRLEVPVEAIGLAGESLRGVSFACASNTTGAKVTWDRFGVLRPSGDAFRSSTGKERYLWEGVNPTRFERRVERVWMEDTIPAGATTGTENDAWNWINSSPTPYSGGLAHRSNIFTGAHQHWFTNVTSPIALQSGDIISNWVYLDGSNTPAEIMLRFADVGGSGFTYQAYWGANNLDYTPGNPPTSMGGLPSTNQWVRLDVPVDSLGLAGKSIKGVSYALYNGRATWDRLMVTRSEMVQEATLGGYDNQVLRSVGQSPPVPLGGNIGVPSLSGQVRRLHQDAQGTPELVTNGSAAASSAPAFDAFGNRLSGTGTTGNVLTDAVWTGYLGELGYWSEPDLGLHYVRARWLSPSEGRWVSVDPIEGEPRYAYVENSPTWMTDFAGMAPQLPHDLKPSSGIIPSSDKFKKGSPNDPFKDMETAFKGMSGRMQTQWKKIGGLKGFFKACDTNPESVFELLLAWDEPFARGVAKAAADIQRATTINGLGVFGVLFDPVSFVLGSKGSGFLINPASYWSGYNATKKTFQFLLPPEVATPEYTEWSGGLLFGIYKFIKDIFNGLALASGFIGRITRHGIDVAIDVINRAKKVINFFDDLWEKYKANRKKIFSMLMQVWKKRDVVFHAIADTANSIFEEIKQSLYRLNSRPWFDKGVTYGLIVANVISIVLIYVEVVAVIGDVSAAIQIIKNTERGAKFAKAIELLLPIILESLGLTRGRPGIKSGGAGEKPLPPIVGNEVAQEAGKDAKKIEAATEVVINSGSTPSAVQNIGKGILDETARSLKPHERAIAEYILEKDGGIIVKKPEPPTTVLGNRQNDIQINGEDWEFKTLFSSGKNTLVNSVKEGMLHHGPGGHSQAFNFVVDARNTTLTETQVLAQAARMRGMNKPGLPMKGTLEKVRVIGKGFDVLLDVKPLTE
ncbi:MAG: RHS repeat-associated core domain-containing protein [Armatimonas sp.]